MKITEIEIGRAATSYGNRILIKVDEVMIVMMRRGGNTRVYPADLCDIHIDWEYITKEEVLNFFNR